VEAGETLVGVEAAAGFPGAAVMPSKAFAITIVPLGSAEVAITVVLPVES
jgi:hypothetical protein